jgi:hypothetical protein
MLKKQIIASKNEEFSINSLLILAKKINPGRYPKLTIQSKM